MIDHAAGALAGACEQCFQALEAERPIPNIRERRTGLLALERRGTRTGAERGRGASGSKSQPSTRQRVDEHRTRRPQRRRRAGTCRADRCVRPDGGAEHEQGEREAGRDRPRARPPVPSSDVADADERSRGGADDCEEHEVERDAVEARRVGERERRARATAEAAANPSAVEVRPRVGRSFRVTLAVTPRKGDRWQTRR